VKIRTFFFALTLAGLTAATPLLSGCGLFGSRAAEAYSEYQAALAAGDMTRAQVALIALVHAKEDVPDYWIELGKIDLQLGQYSQAYDAFSHAHELDRTNIDVQAALTELALLSGQVDLADEQAKTLALLAPDHPAVALVRGYVALQSGDLDKANAEADGLLANTPSDPNAKILKARILIDRKQLDDAVALLENQHQTVPDDRASIRALSALYRNRGDWRSVARLQSDLHKLDPNDPNVSRALVEASLRAGDVGTARAVSLPLLATSSSPQLIDSTLDVWASSAPSGVVLPGSGELAGAMTGERRVAFADYFNEVAKPASAAALLGRSQLPVTPANSRWNAVFAQAMALQGRTAEAKQLFDLVLLAEPDQVDALRGRSALEAKNGMAKQAIVDAQRLISVTPKTGDDRLLLAQAYLASGNREEVRRTLWQAFQDLPDDSRVFTALKNVLVSTGDLDGAKRLGDEFADQRFDNLKKDLI
jgi:tetratricopeptide (TPR) repeat protein